MKPALKMVNASENPIKGGLSVALASGVVHYGLVEIVGQVSDVVLGTNFADVTSKTVFMNLPVYVHALFIANMGINFGEGVRKYFVRRQYEKN